MSSKINIILILKSFFATQSRLPVVLFFVLPAFVVVLFPDARINGLLSVFAVLSLFLVNSAVILLRLKADIDAIKQTLTSIFFLLLIAVAGIVVLLAGLMGMPYANLIANYLSIVFMLNMVAVLRNIYVLVKKDIVELIERDSF